MITMVDKQTIIHLYRSRGLSKRAIARELDIRYSFSKFRDNFDYCAPV